MHQDTYVLWAGYTTGIQCSYQETMDLLARLERFNHHPLEKERLEKKARVEGEIYRSVVFSLVVGQALARVRLRS
jgi:hypothetical protein